MRAVRMLLIAALGLLGTTVVGSPAQAGGPTVDEQLKVSWPLRVEKRLRATPIEGGTSYYCVVGVFVSFNDVAGFEPTSVEATYFDKPLSEPIGAAPYDDNASQNGIPLPPVGAAHQTQIGDVSYSQGGYASADAAAADCEALRQRVDDFFGPGATIVYEHTAACAAKIQKLLAAQDKVKKAKKKVENTTGPAHAAAVQQLKAEKAKLKKAKKKYKAACK